jgi:hypothetical protein
MLRYSLTPKRFSFNGLQMSYVAVLIVVQFTLTLLVPGLMTVTYDNLPGLSLFAALSSSRSLLLLPLLPPSFSLTLKIGVAGLILFLHAVSVAVLEHILHIQDTGIYPFLISF